MMKEQQKRKAYQEECEQMKKIEAKQEERERDLSLELKEKENKIAEMEAEGIHGQAKQEGKMLSLKKQLENASEEVKEREEGKEELEER